MSHIRPTVTITEVCPTCSRDGYKRRIHRNLKTESEYKKAFEGSVLGGTIERIKGLPDFYEMMYTSCGSSIQSAIEEAKAYCVDYGVPGVAFDFNGKPVLVTALSDVDKVYRAWWQDVYKETPEESFARR